MSEIFIRETLVFAGAAAGAVWGYFLGRFIERRRLASEIGPGLHALAQWAIKVSEGLEGLERTLGTEESVRSVSDPAGWNPADTRVAPGDEKVRVLSITPSERSLKRMISG